MIDRLRSRSLTSDCLTTERHNLMQLLNWMIPYTWHLHKINHRNQIFWMLLVQELATIPLSHVQHLQQNHILKMVKKRNKSYWIKPQIHMLVNLCQENISASESTGSYKLWTKTKTAVHSLDTKKYSAM